MRCEGYRRYGGAFSLGPSQWRQCEDDAIVILTVVQEKEERLPACLVCWNESRLSGIKIKSVAPIAAKQAKGGESDT